MSGDLTPEERAEVQEILDEMQNETKRRVFLATERTFAVMVATGFPTRTLHSTNLERNKARNWLRKLLDKWDRDDAVG